MADECSDDEEDLCGLTESDFEQVDIHQLRRNGNVLFAELAGIGTARKNFHAKRSG
jgi:hypothetical protein